MPMSVSLLTQSPWPVLSYEEFRDTQATQHVRQVGGLRVNAETRLGDATDTRD